jgi:peptidoglycan hydrolase-like protein with peptidoglycan-binding domain
MTPNQLQAKYWANTVVTDQDQKRLQLAAFAPFHSVHAASGDNGSSVVMAIQGAFGFIAQYSSSIMSPSDGSSSWGPFPITNDEADSKTFGPTTISSVRQFQKQASITQDGKVGMDTFSQLDSLMVDIEAANPSSSNADGDDSDDGPASSQ